MGIESKRRYQSARLTQERDVQRDLGVEFLVGHRISDGREGRFGGRTSCTKSALPRDVSALTKGSLAFREEVRNVFRRC